MVGFWLLFLLEGSWIFKLDQVQISVSLRRCRGKNGKRRPAGALSRVPSPGKPGIGSRRGTSGSPGGQLRTAVALRGEPVSQVLLPSPTHPSTQALTCKNKDVHHVQAGVEPGRNAEPRVRLGSLAPSPEGTGFPPQSKDLLLRSCPILTMNNSSAITGLSLGSLLTVGHDRASGYFESQTWSLELTRTPDAPSSVPSFLVHRGPSCFSSQKAGPGRGWACRGARLALD